jgi:hypothetical protein
MLIFPLSFVPEAVPESWYVNPGIFTLLRLFISCHSRSFLCLSLGLLPIQIGQSDFLPVWQKVIEPENQLVTAPKEFNDSRNRNRPVDFLKVFHNSQKLIADAGTVLEFRLDVVQINECVFDAQFRHTRMLLWWLWRLLMLLLLLLLLLLRRMWRRRWSASRTTDSSSRFVHDIDNKHPSGSRSKLQD